MIGHSHRNAFLTTVAVVSVGAKADITSYQQVWEHFSQLLDRQDGWVVWDICRSTRSILVRGRGSGREKEEMERKGNGRRRGEERGGGMEEGDKHLLIHVSNHIEDFGGKTHSHSIA